ncbi:uncharacterized protein [Miscanthus floridulus]|uniref:uncharacterized protein n=1 Tax=Miscanthus floridulus TaxID=154761 RepID=UPI003459DC36
MQARQLWDAVEFGDVEFHDDRRALEALCAAVPLEIGAFLANKATAKEAWDSIATAHLGDYRIRRAMLQWLRQEWEGLTFNSGEQVEDFAFRLSSLKEQMAYNGDTDITDARAVEKLLRCIPKKRRTRLPALVRLGSVVTDHAAARRTRDPQGTIEEQDHAPFLVHGCVELRQETGEEKKDSRFPLPASANSSLLHLDEPRTHAFLGTGPDNDKIDSWYLDTDATHHMTGRREFFSDLDSSVRGSVKFGDTSAMEF